jgi:hypothetical protein
MSVYTTNKKEPEIRKVYDPPEQLEEKLRHVYTRFYQMGEARQTEENNWDKWEKQWECYRPPKDADDWKSDIYVPITTSTIEAMMSEIINQELKPWAIERGAEDAPKAMVVNNILEYTWDVAKSDIALSDIIHDALKLGTGIGQEYYWKQ